MEKLEYQNKPCYLENRVVREPCKQRSACILQKIGVELIFFNEFFRKSQTFFDIEN